MARSMTIFQLVKMSSIWKGSQKSTENNVYNDHELTPADAADAAEAIADGHDGLFHGDENLLVSHEPGSYIMSNQFF